MKYRIGVNTKLFRLNRNTLDWEVIFSTKGAAFEQADRFHALEVTGALPTHVLADLREKFGFDNHLDQLYFFQVPDPLYPYIAVEHKRLLINTPAAPYSDLVLNNIKF